MTDRRYEGFGDSVDPPEKVVREPKRDNFYQKFWDRKRNLLVGTRIAGFVTARRVGKRIEVSAPYNDAFRVGAQQLGAHYRRVIRVWSFPGESHPRLVALLSQCYGPEAVPMWMRLLERGGE